MSTRQTNPFLQFAAATLIGFGVVITAAAWPALAGPTRLLTDLIFWPLDGAQDLSAPEARLLCAICGGLLVGWGVTIWQIAVKVAPGDNELARSLIMTGLWAWFVVDSAGSVVSGGWINVIFNTGFLVLFLYALSYRGAPAAAGG